MPVIKLESVIDGDILAEDVVINEVTLFQRGTVITSQIIKILKMLKVASVSVESRTAPEYRTLGEAFKNLDERFSYVKDDKFMMAIKAWIKDILRERTIEGE